MLLPAMCSYTCYCQLCARAHATASYVLIHMLLPVMCSYTCYCQLCAPYFYHCQPGSCITQVRASCIIVLFMLLLLPAKHVLLAVVPEVCAAACGTRGVCYCLWYTRCVRSSPHLTSHVPCLTPSYACLILLSHPASFHTHAGSIATCPTPPHPTPPQLHSCRRHHPMARHPTSPLLSCSCRKHHPSANVFLLNDRILRPGELPYPTKTSAEAQPRGPPLKLRCE